MIAGGAIALATGNALAGGLTLQQIFLLTVFAWVAVCFFGALPLVLGAPELSWLDAIFEATSGLTNTGATMIVGLDDLPQGANLWRAMLHWLGGLGIVIVAMLFLPVMKVGGMQFFRLEGFDTLGKVLPRALDISSALVQVYVVRTVACALAYAALGVTGFEAVVLQLHRLYAPNAVHTLRFDGRAVDDDVLNAVISFFTLFMLSFGLLSVALALTGLEFKTAVTAAWTAIANVGPAFGPEVAPTGALSAFPEAAKWVMIFGMLLGRLELMAVFVILLPRFWRT